MTGKFKFFFAISLLSFSIFPKISYSIDAQVGATVVSPLIAYINRNLNFGQFFAGSTNGQIIITTTSSSLGSAGSVSSNGGTTPVPNTGAQNAYFTFSGEPNAAVNIAVDQSVTITSGNSTMQVTITPFQIPNVLDSTGRTTLQIGGTLNVGANQPSGFYAGIYSVVATY